MHGTIHYIMITRPHIKDIFKAIAAKTDSGDACCDWVGQGGSGHYVKMVHNGIEYGDMQILCEAYSLLKNVVGLSHKEMGDIFEVWNTGELDSFLVEITRDILRFEDADGSSLVEKIRDTAGQVRLIEIISRKVQGSGLLYRP